MSNLLAGVGIAQMEVLEERVQQKRRIFERYQDALADIEGLQFMPEYQDTTSNRWLTTFTIDHHAQMSPVEMIDALEQKQIEARRVWKPAHQRPLFHGYPFYTTADEVPASELLFETGLCLPSGTSMTDAEQELVIDTLYNALQRKHYPPHGARSSAACLSFNKSLNLWNNKEYILSFRFKYDIDNRVLPP